MDSQGVLSRLLAPLWRRVELMVARGVIKLVADGGKLQHVQLSLLAGETRENIERLQEYGFTSHPHPDAEAVAVFVGGNRGHGLIVACDDRRYRIKGLAQGEVCLYTDEGDTITLKRGNIIEINGASKVVVNTDQAEVNAATSCVVTTETAEIEATQVNVTASAQVNVDTPLANFTGNLVVTGMVAAAGFGTGGLASVQTGKVKATTVEDSVGTLAAVRSAHNGHTHTAPSGGGTTSGPSVTA